MTLNRIVIIDELYLLSRLLQFQLKCVLQNKKSTIHLVHQELMCYEQLLLKSQVRTSRSIEFISVFSLSSKSGSPCLTCYLSGGRIHVYSLPSLRELFMTTLESVTESFR